MSKKEKQEQLDRIEKKLDEVLAFRDWIQARVGGLLGASDGALSAIASRMVGGLSKSGAAGNGN